MIGGRVCVAGIGCAVLLAAMPVMAEDWPGWRGPRGDGSSTETSVPTEIGPERHLLWKAAVPGRGHSSPVVVGDRIYLSTCIDIDPPAGQETATEPAPAGKSRGKPQPVRWGRRVLLCYAREDGKLLWQREIVTARLERIHLENSHASSTPVADDQHVWVSFLSFPDVVVACFDREGRMIWQRSPGRFYSRHGYGCALTLWRDTVIVNCDQDPPADGFPELSDQPAEAYIVALAKSDGKQVWRIDRPNRTRSYCPPLLVRAAGRDQMVLAGSKCVASYDPDTGKPIWHIDGPTQQFVASLIHTDGVLFLTYGFPARGLMGIRPDGTGNVTRTHVLWNDNRGGAYVPAPVGAGGLAFVVVDNGVAHCIDVKTGEKKWTQRLGRHHHASPVRIGERLLFVDDDGEVFVLAAKAEFQVLHRASLGEECFASPAVAAGRLYIRTAKHLWCFGAR